MYKYPVKTIFTSITMVAISLVGSNMRFSCFSGPIKKQVLQTKKKEMNNVHTEQCS